MLDPWVAAVLFFAAVCIPVWIAAAGKPRPPRRHGRDYAAMAEIEDHDIDQMIEGLNERRRRNGRAEIGDELVAELRRDPRTRER